MRLRKILVVALSLALPVALAVVALGPKRVVIGGKKKLERGWLILMGELVDVGGHRLRLERMGRGTPTVVFEAGLAQPRTSWGRVPNDVAEFAQVVIYDRANLGDSDEINQQRTSKQIVAELRALLNATGVEAPYLLVGHSFGGLNARLFASQFPDEVAGIVLVDASHENEYGRYAELLSEPQRTDYLKHEGGGNYERIDLLASAEEIRVAAPLKPLPLVVVSASGKQETAIKEDREKIHDELQFLLSRLSPYGTQILADNSGHFVQLDRPELVTNAIRTVFEQARQAQRKQ